MPDSIEEHIRIAKYIMRDAAKDLDNWETYNDAGRRYLLESALRRTTDAYQRVFAAKVQYDNAKDEAPK
jgi:hypothetical protein